MGPSFEIINLAALKVFQRISALKDFCCDAFFQTLKNVAPIGFHYANWLEGGGVAQWFSFLFQTKCRGFMSCIEKYFPLTITGSHTKMSTTFSLSLFC